MLMSQNIKYTGEYRNIGLLPFFIVLLIAIPLMINTIILVRFILYIILFILFYYFILKKIYKIEICDNVLTQSFLIGRNKKEFIIDKVNIVKVFFGFPATKSLPFISIFFIKPSCSVAFTCSDRRIINQFYNYFTSKEITCIIHPESENNQIDRLSEYNR